jgi:hypothetical protein
MPSGGIRSGAGRPPQEHSRRLDRAAAKGQVAVVNDGDWLTLPKEGRKGNPPAWPFPTRATKAERDLWRSLWKLPQALGWERAHQHHQVALYVRTLVRAQDPESPIGLTNSTRQLQDSLGLSEAGLRMLRWRIGRAPSLLSADASPHGAGGEQTTTTSPPRRSTKERMLRAVPSGT